MTTLHDRLSDLADEAPVDMADGGIWTIGRRRHRRQQLGTVVVVATVVGLLAGVAGLDWSRSHVDIQPASEVERLGFPDRFYWPSEDLPTTEDTGPIGPLSALLSGIQEPVGISGTGEYAILDLPGWSRLSEFAGPREVELSADGTRVAYWSTGRTTGAPVEPGVEPFAGVSVYDTVTGDVATYPVRSEHGLMPTDLVWGGDHVWFEVWHFEAPSDDGSSSSSLVETVAWNAEDDTWRTWDQHPQGLDLSTSSSWGDSVVTLGGQGSLRLFGAEGVELRARFAGQPDIASAAYLDESGRRAVALRDVDGSGTSSDVQMPVLIATLPDPADATAPVSWQEVPGTAENGVQLLLGWRDRQHVVGYRYGDGIDSGFVFVDVTTGEIESLPPFDTNIPDLAADALAGPVFDAPPPPDPLDGRLVYGSITAILVAGGAALLWWRRRVQR